MYVQYRANQELLELVRKSNFAVDEFFGAVMRGFALSLATLEGMILSFLKNCQGDTVLSAYADVGFAFNMDQNCTEVAVFLKSKRFSGGLVKISPVSTSSNFVFKFSPADQNYWASLTDEGWQSSLANYAKETSNSLVSKFASGGLPSTLRNNMEIVIRFVSLTNPNDSWLGGKNNWIFIEPYGCKDNRNIS